MKKHYHILLLAGLLLSGSCTKTAADKCASVTCQNSGTCSDGLCQCPTGYSGPSCETAANGNVRFYLAQDYNVGNVDVTINGITKTIRDFYDNADCDWKGYAVFSLPPGTYNFTAAGGNLTWSGTVQTYAGLCKAAGLDYSGATGTALKGDAGAPRFNLSFPDASANIDLHVLTPNNEELFWNNTTAGAGKMDLVYNFILPNTNPQENISFSFNAEVHGTYKVWAKYTGHDGSSYPNQFYTIRILDGMSVVQTYTGTLTSTTTSSPVYEYTY